MTLQVQLFATCLTEQFFPGVLEKMVGILERLDVAVSFPPNQTCCGQPYFNSGFQDEARKMALNWLKTFQAKTGKNNLPIVSPSGSCVNMVRHHYPELFAPGTPEHKLALDIAGRTYELSEFLVHQLNVTDLGARYPHKVTYHASCHLLRGLGIKEEPKQLLRAVQGLELVPMMEEETCCGFGGVFSVIYPEVSRSMMEQKLKNIINSGAENVVACDAGCLMNIGGGLRKAGTSVKALHIIDILSANEPL
jgi:L-lactate dehydrogenase complex protein LldE